MKRSNYSIKRKRVFPSLQRHTALWSHFIVLLGLGLMPASYASTVSTQPNVHPFTIATKVGEIDIELYEDQAPDTVRKIVKLINGPIFNLSLVGNGKDTVGYYDGLTFNYTKPHIEITTSERPPHKLIEFDVEISAEALGLDKKLITNQAQAMDILQQKILKSVYRGDKHRTHSPVLQQWLDLWDKSYDPGFLIGVSAEEINTALGYNYIKDISSKPVLKGSIVLKPASKTSASPRISIILQDMPGRTGKWMVIGRVTKGLEIADEISLLPLDTPRNIKTRIFKPKQEIVIKSIK